MRPMCGVPGTESKTLATHIRNMLIPVMILNRNPRTLIQLSVQSLSPQKQEQGRQPFSPPLVAACINASMLALLNASSIPLKGVVCAVAVGFSSSKGEIVLDPPETVESGGCFAFMFGGDEGSEETVWSNWKTTAEKHTSSNAFELAKERARAGAKDVYNTIKTSWTANFSQDNMQMDD